MNKHFNLYILYIMRIYLLFSFCTILLFPVKASTHLVNKDVGVFDAGMLHPSISSEHPYSIGLPTEESLTELVKKETLSLPVIVGAFIAAMLWGAAHALTPGHGKTIVGAYLVGSRGTPMHAVYLGLTVTVTHTICVFALGLIALFASSYILAEQLTPWLAAASGLIVVVIGASMFITRAIPILRRNANRHIHAHHHTEDDHNHHHDHDHEHDHDHDHNNSHEHDHHHDFHHHGHHTHSHLPLGADGANVTWRSLMGLGISGGLLPCPSALVLLLTAVSLERIGFGIVLVIAFSLGLAGVLTTVGLLFIKGSRLLNGVPGATPMRRYVPALSAFIILVIGAVITVNAFAKLSF